MKYIVACDSTVGAVREVNQDAAAYIHVVLDGDEVLLALVCDGMGGFEQGEFASTTVLMAYVDWFKKSFMKHSAQMNEKRLRKEWTAIANLLNQELYKYGQECGFSIGTTVTMLLLWGDSYYIFHVGDTRVYKLAETIEQITKDHSVVAREVALGHITAQEARFDPRNNQILRCVGGSVSTKGDFYTGTTEENMVFLICCDGVRNRVYDEELLYFFHPTCMTCKENLSNNIKYIFDLNIAREESDNMSLVVIKAEGNGADEADKTIRDGTASVIGEHIIINSEKYIGLEFEG